MMLDAGGTIERTEQKTIDYLGDKSQARSKMYVVRFKSVYPR
jgi:hypothetical protein